MVCGAGLGVTIPSRPGSRKCGAPRRPSAASTSALRGSPLARPVMPPSAPSTNTVGVRRTSSAGPGPGATRRRSPRARCPARPRATSARMTRVARHGAQNAEENCSSVARSPSGWPIPAGPAVRRAGRPGVSPAVAIPATAGTAPRAAAAAGAAALARRPGFRLARRAQPPRVLAAGPHSRPGSVRRDGRDQDPAPGDRSRKLRHAVRHHRGPARRTRSCPRAWLVCPVCPATAFWPEASVTRRLHRTSSGTPRTDVHGGAPAPGRVPDRGRDVRRSICRGRVSQCAPATDAAGGFSALQVAAPAATATDHRGRGGQAAPSAHLPGPRRAGSSDVQHLVRGHLAAAISSAARPPAAGPRRPGSGAAGRAARPGQPVPRGTPGSCSGGCPPWRARPDRWRPARRRRVRAGCRGSPLSRSWREPPFLEGEFEGLERVESP